jgi:hypothetical protein
MKIAGLGYFILRERPNVIYEIPEIFRFCAITLGGHFTFANQVFAPQNRDN